MKAAAEELKRLLHETVSPRLPSAWRITGIETAAMRSGMSGAAVLRHYISLGDASGRTSLVRLVTKAADLRERRVLTHLTAQVQANVPFSHTLDLSTDGPALICMADVGDTYRPTSLEPITLEAVQREAEGLASIHAANRSHERELVWLPRIDRRYFADDVIERWWRPAWQKALANPGFRSTFSRYLEPVEAAAAPMVDAMSALAAETDTLTLVHTDINPSNVLIYEGRPFFIDWQVAHYGPFYLDLPHHFCTLEQAEHYRLALLGQGLPISPTDFAERYREATRCIGFRYLWWTLEEWRPDPQSTAWVMHYINLILGAS